MLGYILLFIGAYFLFRFIFGFVIPVANAALSMRRKMKDMQGRMNTYQNGGNTTPQDQTNQQPTSPKPAAGDYIDFEEVK